MISLIELWENEAFTHVKLITEVLNVVQIV